MPKMKSKSSIKKRIKVTGTGKLKRGRAGASHILTKKNAKRKRRLTSSSLVHGSDLRRIRRLISS